MHEVETMFSARETPWHGLGVVTPDALSAQEAIVAAGLDWNVVKEQAERHGKLVPGKFWTIREKDDKVLGIVGPDWKPLQNVEGFAFSDGLLDGGASFETAGSLRGGRVVFMTVKLPGEVLVAGDDAHEMYLLFRMGHDGKMSINAEIVMIRVVCMNTLSIAIRGAKRRWTINHTSKMEGKLQQAREALELSWKFADAFEEEVDNLLNVTVTDEMLVRLLQDNLPQRPKTDDVISTIKMLSHESNTIQDKFKGTGWGALNAVTEYFDHGRGTRSKEASFFTTFDGEGARIREAMHKQLLTVNG